jgi:hypothetical protein
MGVELFCGAATSNPKRHGTAALQKLALLPCASWGSKPLRRQRAQAPGVTGVTLGSLGLLRYAGPESAV